MTEGRLDHPQLVTFFNGAYDLLLGAFAASDDLSNESKGSSSRSTLRGRSTWPAGRCRSMHCGTSDRSSLGSIALTSTECPSKFLLRESGFFVSRVGRSQRSTCWRAPASASSFDPQCGDAFGRGPVARPWCHES